MGEPKPFLRWALEEACGISDVGSQWWLIENAYGEPHRRYHTLDHIEEMVEFFYRHRRYLAERQISLQDLVLAAIYHDIVYDPTASDNEEQSVEVFQVHMAATVEADNGRVCRYTVQVVSDLIMNTKAHLVDFPRRERLGADAWLIDADLMRFAAPPEESRRHNDNIREEYSFISDADWAAGREKALTRFLVREPFFYTAAFTAEDGSRARQNILDEIARWQKPASST